MGGGIATTGFSQKPTVAYPSFLMMGLGRGPRVGLLSQSMGAGCELKPLLLALWRLSSWESWTLLEAAPLSAVEFSPGLMPPAPIMSSLGGNFLQVYSALLDF